MLSVQSPNLCGGMEIMLARHRQHAHSIPTENEVAKRRKMRKSF